MGRLSDVSLPMPEHVQSVIRTGLDAGGLATGATAAAAGLSGTPLAALVVLMAKGYSQEKGVEWTARADHKLSEVVAALDGEERSQHCLGRVLQGVQTLLPDGSQYRDPSLRTAEGEPQNLAALFQAYQDSPQRRREMEAAVERVLAGKIDQAALAADHDDFVDYLRDAFGVDTRDEALAMFLDFRELLQAREVHETVSAVEDIEFDQEALSRKLDTTGQRLADRLDEVLEADLENEGVHRLSPYYFDQREPRSTPTTCWRVGFQPADVRAGYALERQEPSTDSALDGDETARRRVTPRLVERLRDGSDIVVTGLPGSGKSTLLLSVACRWYEHQHGTVFYRRNGHAVSAFEDTGTLAQRIDDAEGHVLVVIEDVVREDANAVFETLRRYAHDPTVSFLFDARVSEWRTDDRLITDTLQLEAKDAIEEYPVPRFDERECARVVEHFEATTGLDVDESPARLFDAIETDLGAGRMYLLGYRLSQYAVGASDREGDAPTGLGSNVRAAYNDLEPTEPGGEDVQLQVGLLVSLLGAAEVGVHPEYLYALAASEEEYRRILEVVDDQQGQLFYGVDAETGTYRVNHPLWGLLFLEEALERNETLAVTRFEHVVNSVLRLFDDPERRRRIDSWTSIETPLLADVAASEVSVVDDVVLSLFDVGVARPTLATLFGTSEDSDIDLPSVCAIETELWCVNKRGRMFSKRGGPGRRSMTVGVESETFGAFAKGQPSGQVAAPTNPSDLERAETEYEHRRRLTRECDAIESEVVREYEGGSLLNLGSVAARRGDYDVAEDRFGRAQTQFEAVGDEQSAANCLMNLGLVAAERGEYEAADDRLRQATQQFEEIGEERNATASRMNLGLVAASRGEYDTAENRFRRARSRFTEGGDEHRATHCLLNLGLVAAGRSEYGAAEDRFRRARSTFAAIGDEHNATTCLMNLGLVAARRGEYEVAEDRLRRARSKFAAIGDEHKATNCLLNRGFVAMKRGRYEDAEDRFNRARSQFESIGDTHSATTCLMNLGSVAARRGEYETAEDRLDRARDQFESIGDEHNATNCLLNLGLVALKWGGHEAVEDRFSRAQRQFEAIGDEHSAANCLMNRGLLSIRRGEYGTAEDRLRRARDQFEAIGDEHSATTCLLNLGSVAMQREHYETAEERFSRARSEFAAIGDEDGVARSEANLGRVAFKQDEFDAAIERYTAAREKFRAAEDAHAFAMATDYLGEAVRARGDLRRACRHFEEALELLLELNVRRDAVPTHRSLATVYEALALEDPQRVEEGIERLLTVADQTGSTVLAKRLEKTRRELDME